MSASLHVGDRIRPWGGVSFGSLGFFCRDDAGTIFVATCDHVVKTLSTPEAGPLKLYFPLGASYRRKVAVYEGRSLALAGWPMADFSIARALLDVTAPTALPAPLPETGIASFTGMARPVAGDRVLLWGARTGSYHSGEVVQASSGHSWPHGKYGVVRYERQFSVRVSGAYTPELGDSGGYVVTPAGELVGLLAALSGVVSEAGDPVVHCVPVQECCEFLGVRPLTQQNMEGEHYV